MRGHDPMCPYAEDPTRTYMTMDGVCYHCDLVTRVRADEREGTVPYADWEETVFALGAAKVELNEYRKRLRTQVEADRDALSAAIAEGPEVHDWDEIDQWACERVALNRVLAMLSEGDTT